ncbi:MAG: hydrogenase maturation nickel metallochaperone HypA/HybF [Lutibacter sp.]
MHELSIAVGIVDLAEKELAKVKETKVSEIELEIGKLSGVEIDALNFVWEAAVKNSVLEHAHKIIHVIEGKAVCSDCNTSFKVENIYDACPNCKGYLKHIIKGKELKVKSLNVY